MPLPPEASSMTMPTTMPTPEKVGFDIRDIPFSVRGAWLNLSPVVALHLSLIHI